MSLEKFRTQVLLLHSRQSILDSWSAGFTDRYSVHCATTGTEALITLGETPINVIISAQDLPGMSGLEALREARKRSPDTIGILLAGDNADDGLEALVGDKELFQIVRGDVTPKQLIELIEETRKRERLLALSESANDTSANVDEPVAEHIVMETSENGSTIISDGTGRLPALKPEKISIAAGAGGREVDVLVLTKDDDFLATVKNSARGLHNVFHAVTPAQAEEYVRKNRIGVLVTDAAMVGSDVNAVTGRLRKDSPRLVAIVAGRRDDGELLMDLINRGHVYRFLLKPVSPGRARLAIEASVKHHMEAPDDAFNPKKDTTPAKPVTRDQQRQATPETVAKKPVAKPAVSKPTPVNNKPKKTPKQRIEPTISKDPVTSPTDRSLDSAFEEPSVVTRTLASFASKVSKSTDGAKKTAPEAAGPSGWFRNPKYAGIAAGSLVALTAAGWFMFSGDDEIETTQPEPVVELPTLAGAAEPVAQQPVIEESRQPIETVVEPPAPAPEPKREPVVPWAGELELARAARDSGNLISPPELNAVELYLAAVDASDGDPVVTAELDAIVSQILSLAESAILAKNGAQAETVMDMVRLANADHPRLTFLDAQLEQLNFRTRVDDARNAIRESRFEDAGVLISEARSLAGADIDEIDALTGELGTARRQRQIEAKIVTANERLDSGALTSPAGDSAQYYFESALADDPNNVAAKQGLIAIAGKIVLQARDAIDDQNLDRADTLLAEASAIDPASAELAAAQSTLVAAREAAAEAARRAEEERLAEIRRQEEAARQAELERQAELQRQAELRRQQEAERQAELARQEQARIEAERRAAEDAEAARIEAEQRANAAATASPLGVGAAAPRKPAPRRQQPTVNATGNSTQTAMPPAESPARPVPTGQPVEQVVRNDTVPADTVTEQVAQPAPQVQEQPASAVNVREDIPTESAPVEPAAIPASQLDRITYVGPEYPRSARRRNVTGSVDVTFIVTTDGRVRDVSVIKSEPGETFDQAAIDAVEQWRFEPIIEDGVAVEKRSAVRLAFDM